MRDSIANASGGLGLRVRLFAGAAVLRWAYALTLHAFMGVDGLLGMDSRGFLSAAQSFAERLAAGTVEGWQFVSTTDLSLMPLVPWLWILCALVFGDLAALIFVLLQGLLDAGTCLFVYGIARSIAPRAALPAALFAVFNPTQIVMAGLFYTDTTFLFLVAWSLHAGLRWMERPSWQYALLTGIGLGLAALTRILIVPWAACFLAILLIAAAIRHRLDRAMTAQLAIASVILALCVAPVIARNIAVYRTAALTVQTGAHYAFWVAPLVRQARDGTPWTQGVEEMKERVRAQMGDGSGNPFEDSRRMEAIAIAAIGEYGVVAVAKAWLVGAAINLGAPAVLISPPILLLPRTGFYATPGNSMTEKIGNFLFRSENAIYTWALIAGATGLVVIRLVQLVGVISLVRAGANVPALLVLLSWIAYILFVNGPIGSPKYRLPIEPALAVFAGAGYFAIRDRFARHSLRT
jgi:4-amino-4-deoxy-L-arabinose transferase-like glycosyltransferase